VLLPSRLNQRNTEACPGAPNATTANEVPTPAVTDPGGGLPLPSTLASDASPQFRAVAEALTGSMRKHRVPGTALGILADDREEHATFGVASMNTLLPVGPNTLFQIGSLTKTYTATTIWRLIDEGKLALDAPVRTYIPDLRLQDEATAARVTVGDLMDTARAGMAMRAPILGKVTTASPAMSPSDSRSCRNCFRWASSSPTTMRRSPCWAA